MTVNEKRAGEIGAYAVFGSTGIAGLGLLNDSAWAKSLSYET